MRLAALINERSGSGRGSEVLADLQANGVDCHVLEQGDDVQAWAQQAIQGGAEALIAAGGDGTIATVAQVAMGRVPMAVAPVGTRNHFALDIGLDPSDPVASLRASLAGDPKGIDVGEINGEIFLNNMSFGIYAAAVSDPAYRSGRLKVLASEANRALASAGESASITTTVPVDIPEGSRVGAILVSNNPYDAASAPGERLRPSLTSGRLQVYLLGIPKAGGRVPLLGALREVLASGSPFLGSWSVEDLGLGADRPVPVASDGEYRPTIVPPYHLRSRHLALEVLLPKRPAPTSSFTLEW